MRKLFLSLTFVSILLPCKGQFNTITRDTMPIRLIGQPDEQVSEASRKGNVVSPSDEVDLRGLEGEKYYAERMNLPKTGDK